MSAPTPIALAAEQGWVFAVLAAGTWAALSACGDGWHARVVAATGSPGAAAFVYSFAVPLCVYVAYGLLFAWVDEGAAWAGFRAKYKVQPGFVPAAGDYAKAARVAALNWAVVTLPYSLLVAYVLGPARGLDEAIPSVPRLLMQMVVTVCVEEALFYYSHAALHRPAVYRWVHKQHHEYKAPFAIAAIYAHPLEHFASNIGPVSAGPLLAGAHPMVMGWWISLAILNTMTSHSGYAVPGLPSPHFHDEHHRLFRVNYGVLGVLDWLHGTHLAQNPRYLRTPPPEDGPLPAAGDGDVADKAGEAAAAAGSGRGGGGSGGSDSKKGQ